MKKEPFTQLMNRLVFDLRLDADAKAIALIIAAHQPKCFVSYEGFARLTQIKSRKTISRALKMLDALGYVEREKWGRKQVCALVWRDALGTSTSSIRELVPVPLGNSIKIKKNKTKKNKIGSLSSKHKNLNSPVPLSTTRGSGDLKSLTTPRDPKTGKSVADYLRVAAPKEIRR